MSDGGRGACLDEAGSGGEGALLCVRGGRVCWEGEGGGVAAGYTGAGGSGGAGAKGVKR